MKDILAFPIKCSETALWFLGQAGYILRSGDVTVVIDPYLTNSVADSNPEFSRLLPSPMEPEDLQADIFVITHDHMDHLDPQTLLRYRYQKSTFFIAPRLAALKLKELGISENRIFIINPGERTIFPGVTIDGIFALPTGNDVLDTTGYKLTFSNGCTVYHTADTGFAPLLLAGVPKFVDVLLVPINGKWGNLTVEQAVEVTAVTAPRYVVPNHYDMMSLNAENPETFAWLCGQRKWSTQCRIIRVMETFLWEH